MDNPIYKTPVALEMAVKAAAKNSEQDTSQAIANYYHDRLLERIFSEAEPAFVLKGGRGMLARTINARHTRDTDFVFRGPDIQDAVRELKRLAAIDLGDFLEFRLVSEGPIVKDQAYRDGYRVVFAPILGGTKHLSKVSVDLVADQVVSQEADCITPASRLDVKGLPVFDYLVYPVACSIADKVCATIQVRTDGRTSSRVRDLVDLVIYITTESFDGTELSERLTRELRLRGQDATGPFAVPRDWHTLYEQSFKKSAVEAKLPREYRAVEKAEKLVQSCVNRALAGETDGLRWSPDNLQWKPIANC